MAESIDVPLGLRHLLCKEAIPMTCFSSFFFSHVARTILAIGANLAVAYGSAAAGEKVGTSAAAPVLVAQAPDNKEASKYDLAYKLSRGDVLRYVVTHQASISGTSDKTTQTAQSKTDSIKAWKVTDILPSGDI
ncbi:MAG TPA: hypothetical protein VKH44_14285, partial [Pirellulaceae bacterium]|nr:hypothetical protein [Pirellulaceae bacterium]